MFRGNAPIYFNAFLFQFECDGCKTLTESGEIGNTGTKRVRYYFQDTNFM